MVNIESNGIDGLINSLKEKKLICFGAGKHFDTVMDLYQSYNLASHCSLIIDNNQELRGKQRLWNEYSYRVESVESLINKYNISEYLILVTCHLYSMEIIRQLDEIDALDGCRVYLGSFLSDTLNYKGKYIVKTEGDINIPKIIHYCWFGGGLIPKEYINYIESWKEKCPDYQIKLWNESNFDVHQNNYISQAYHKEKWAFVSDYARIKILNDEGGIYLDCDVELLKNLDVFLVHEFFCGFEDANHVNFGLGFGAVKNHPILRDLLNMYDSMNFVNEDGSLNMTPCTAYQTRMILKYGFKAKNEFQYINKMAVYPTEILAPISPWDVENVSNLAFSIHHYSASWQSKENMSQIMEMYNEYYTRVLGKEYK